MKHLVIIPAYNEEAALPEVIDSVRLHLPDADLLVINDGSTDFTSRLAREKGVAVIDLPDNLGIGGAMQTGFLYAQQKGYKFACQLDGDGQHNPADAESLFAPVLSGQADLVIGSRFLVNTGDQSSPLRRMGIGFFSGLISLFIGKRITDATSGFRAMNRKALELFAIEYAVDFPEPEMLILAHKNGLVIEEIPVSMQRRQGGSSSITFSRSAYYMSKVTLAILVGMLRR